MPIEPRHLIAPRTLRTMFALASLLALSVLWAPQAATAATEHSEQQELVASDAEAGMNYGQTVAMDGDVLVVGALFKGNDEGAAYVYRLTNGSWSEEAILSSGSDGFPGQLFSGYTASAVAVAGDTIVVGAPNDDDEGAFSGAAYVFTYDGSAWSSTPQKLTASPGSASANFGMQVSISEDASRILVAESGSSWADPGKVHVFEHDGTSYAHEQTLTAPDGANYDQFGVMSRIAQDTIVVSAWGDDNANGVDAGALYVYEWNDGASSWDYDEKLLISGGQAGWRLGWALAISPDGNTIATSTAAGLEGGVYVFERSGATWAEVGPLAHPVDTGDWLMGDSIALSNDTLVVGHSAMASEIGGAHVYRRAGATWALAHRLLPSDGVAGDYEAAPGDANAWGDWAGSSVTMSGANIAIGSPNHDDGGAQAGSVYVFQHPSFGQASNHLTEQQELVPSDAEAGMNYGQTVAMDGDVLVVGALFKGNDEGAAYVYRLTNGSWTEEAILSSGSDGFPGQLFSGYTASAVAVAGDTIVVGAPNDDDEGAFSGAAYVFTYDGSAWSSTPQKLTASPGSASANFGMQVSISEDASRILVAESGSSWADPGKVHVFEHDGTSYAHEQTLTAPDGANYDQFGVMSRIAQDTIVVSAWGDDNAKGVDAGALYVYEWNDGASSWDYDEKLLISGGQAGWRLGWALAISPDGNTIATSTAAGLEGGVYLFERSGATWAEVGTLAHPVDTGDWLMGDSIALSNDTLVVGHSAMNEEIGGAYIYRPDGAAWTLAHRLLPSDGGPGDYEAAPGDANAWGDWSGSSVTMSGANIAIGSPNHDDGAPQAGSVFVFRDPGTAADDDTDGLSDDLESSFGGTDPDDSLSIDNAETGDVAYAEGSASEGVTLFSGSYAIELPPNTSVDTLGGADQIQITMVSGVESRVAVSGADLDGGTKSITIPFDASGSNPAICIDDSPTATVDSVLDAGSCSGTTIAIPAAVGGSSTVGPYTVTRLVEDRASVSGLSHTALASFDIDNAPPSVDSVSSSASLVTVGTTVSASASFSDPDDGDGHVAHVDWGDGSVSSGAVDQSANSVSATHVYDEPGVHVISVTVTDADGDGASAAAAFEYVVAYDPDGGFATGGGRFDSPAGACTWTGCDESTEGEATFGFVSKYLPGGGPGGTPSGNTTFLFKAGDLKFKSIIQGWLVIAGQNKAKFLGGTGQINNQGDYGYMVTVVDNGSSGDTFRIKIWDNQSGGGVVYDNKMGTGDESYDGTEITAGNIKVHKD